MGKRKIPRCNGRPQLWSRCNFHDLRIVFPDGRVDYSYYDEYIMSGDEWWWNIGGCTKGNTQREAIENIIEYDINERDCKPPQFLGYL